MTTIDKATKAIERAGILLVFPIKNEREPPSIWYALYPRTTMRWDWSETADDRVVRLWHLKTVLSEGRDVVYAKWFRGRATFFSREVFTAMLALLGAPAVHPEELPGEAGSLYQLLLEDSPQTPRMMRGALGLEGRIYESAFNRALRPLWERLLTVGFGEVDEGNFPAAAVGATKVMYEELWEDASGLREKEAWDLVRARLPEDSPFLKQLERTRRKLFK